jgi:ATP-binding cassette subfamily B multidrug efflux pump
MRIHTFAIVSKTTGGVDFQVFRKVLLFAFPHRGLLTGSVTATLLLAIISPLRPKLIEYTLDNYVANADIPGIIRFSFYNGIFLLFECGLIFLSVFSNGYLGQHIIRDLRMRLYEKFLGLGPVFYDRHPIGTLVTRVISDIQNIADVFSQGFLEILGDVLKIIAIISIMLYTDVRLTLISLSTIPLLFYATWLFKNAIQSSFREVRNAVANLNAFVQEHITGMMIVQAFTREKEEEKGFKEINSKHRDANIRSNWAYSVFFPVVELLSALSVGLLIWWGSRQAIAGFCTPGTLVAFIMYIQMLFRPIRMLADRFNTLQMGVICAERVFQMLDVKEDIIDKGTLHASAIGGKIEFRDVWFSYTDKQEWVLKGISFVIQPGESLAIVGETGSGKTTLVSLLNRFYQPIKGDILIDDIPIEHYQLDSLRARMSMVLQEVFLFSESILENIRMGDPRITSGDIEQAASDLGASELVRQFKEGWHFKVKERGSLLSTGQRQIIAFIRAYVRKPSILILDEATANIDSESERKIQHATQLLVSRQTSVVVAHRLSTIRNANKILLFSKGQIAEQGTHQQLMAMDGMYKRLYTLQFEKVNAEI